MDNHYKSYIPKEAKEKTVSEYRLKDGCVWNKKTECWYKGKIVGERFYEKDDTLVIERPIKEGKIHGVEYHWSDDGLLYSSEPYENGLPHGTAKQWDDNGTLIGTYTLHHGTGYDIWRYVNEKGEILISEIHSMKDGNPHGFEWWVNEDQESIHTEKHWFEGIIHGIERQWEIEGDLIKGWPKYWINNVEVAESEYIKESQKDLRLPAFSEKDQNPMRVFPAEIKKIMLKC